MFCRIFYVAMHLKSIFIFSAISRCYNFGPTFRADMSVDRTHLAEFYMVEAEMAFTKSLEDVLEVNIWFNIEMILNAESSKIIRF